MPNRDGTGPQGQGPLSGRKMGSCKESEDRKDKDNVVYGLGRGGRPRGGGLGFGGGRRNAGRGRK